MKQTFAVLLISFGVYCFAFGLYISVQSMETERVERLKTIVYPGEQAASVIKPSPMAKYPIGLFLLSASGTTFGIWSGIHLLWQSKTAKNKSKKKTS